MATDIHNLIAAISPDVYCDPEKRKEVKDIIKKGLQDSKNDTVYLQAAKKAKFIGMQNAFFYDKAKHKPFDLWGIKNPTMQYHLAYDSAAEGLEPAYYWIYDFTQSVGLNPVKITDTFSSSPGSGHFSELQGKATRMQEEAMKMLGSVNQVIKSILNIIYDLRDFEMRLKLYADYKDGTENKKQAALLSLKQIWMDTVDAVKRGTTSLKGLAQNFDYVTLIDAFMAAESIDDIVKSEDKGGLDLNDRVRRILQQRVSEFYDWIELSEKELTKRFEIEKSYLRSQYNTIQLYSRWIKPYLVAAKKLEQAEYEKADLITGFNTVILQLVLRVETLKYYSVIGAVDDDVSLPEDFKKKFEKGQIRKYMPFFILELNFRSIPQKVGQHYAFGGRADIKFTSYALNEDEIKILEGQLSKDDVNEAMAAITGLADDSLKQLAEDISHFLDEDVKVKEKKEKKDKESKDTNPFTSLFSGFSGEKKSANPLYIKPDNEYEKVIRSEASLTAMDKCFLVFDVYKKAHGMLSHDTPYEPL